MPELTQDNSSDAVARKHVVFPPEDPGLLINPPLLWVENNFSAYTTALRSLQVIAPLSAAETYHDSEKTILNGGVKVIIVDMQIPFSNDGTLPTTDFFKKDDDTIARWRYGLKLINFILETDNKENKDTKIICYTSSYEALEIVREKYTNENITCIFKGEQDSIEKVKRAVSFAFNTAF